MNISICNAIKLHNIIVFIRIINAYTLHSRIANAAKRGKRGTGEQTFTHRLLSFPGKLMEMPADGTTEKSSACKPLTCTTTSTCPTDPQGMCSAPSPARNETI